VCGEEVDAEVRGACAGDVNGGGDLVRDDVF